MAELGVVRRLHPSPVKAALTAVCLVCLAACAHRSDTSAKPPKPQLPHDYSVGHWENPFRGNPKLAGVVVQQFGECVYDQHLWEGKHPCGIYFYFWDGRVRQRSYEPDGTLREDFWWPDRLKSGDARWSDVDFSHGSDPTLKHHADPRSKQKATNA